MLLIVKFDTRNFNEKRKHMRMNYFADDNHQIVDDDEDDHNKDSGTELIQTITIIFIITRNFNVMVKIVKKPSKKIKQGSI
ncbi:hypothetical protein DERF_008231 [Dermatophagoides farinae]|uniref:Uncharacterized protein n=1 Tax=Dermatophagoides farinae TaxID=6954 RepID=A0A922HZI8_DERFA|nr:hypothetical protein DERF_008231 [Dermatophagoides farinae]